MTKDNFENVHWADNSAQRVIDTFPNEKVYTVASGVTPSGIVHVGHFREVITTELVRRALENKGKKTKFIYSWDSYDAFRKVPKNMPENFKDFLRLPDFKVPDPDNEFENYAEKWMKPSEEILNKFGFPIEFQRQHLLQTSGIYADGIRKHLRLRKEIRLILDKFRKEALPKDWLPLTLYCEKCHKDTTDVFDYDEEYSLSYKCKSCNNENRINFKENPIVKLPWRLDWPMRWDYYKVCFEPGGKDHSTPGGSFDTAKEIIKIVSKREAPVYTFYNFIGMKGQGGKISSSSGNGATLQDVLDIYTKELVLFLFAGTRPNAEFDISFDLDVIKIYEDFDKLERIYYGIEKEENLKKLATLKRTYELSQTEKIPKKISHQFSFRHLVNVIQSNDFNFEKVKEFYKNEIKSKSDEKRLKDRFNCASNWIKEFAPEDMKFSILKSLSNNLDEKEKSLLLDIRTSLENSNSADDLFPRLKNLMAKYGIEMKDFFKFVYLNVVGKEKGPKLTSFMIENKSKIIDLFSKL